MIAQELRIGNYVKCKKSNDAGWYQIWQLGINEQVGLSGVRENEKLTLADIKPIKLTTDLLEKCGFVNVSIGGRSLPLIEDTPYGRKSITVTENTDISGNLWCLIMTTFPPAHRGNIGTDCIFIRRDLRYLHELQNCIHSLGTDLNVNL